MLFMTSIALVVLFTSYCIYYTYKRREQLNCMSGMMISMTIGMMSSISLGAILGVLLNRDLTFTTIIAVTSGMVAGYLTGRPITLMAAMDGIMAGVMGGMMGAMLGVMLLPNSSNLMILFVDLIFVVIMFLLLQLIDEESGASKKEVEPVRKPLIANPIFLVAIFAFIGVMAWGKYGQVEDTNSGQQNTQVQELATGNYQEATITVDSSGYGPENLELKAGMPIKINFKTGAGAGCLRQVVSKELGINTILEENTNNFDMIGPLEPGVYEYTCGMGMYGGKITVK
ncbi:cupredoxin domain-containing protein [Ammoniphilus sp. 3BR4]|uniref:cupredoxin domain-containing protein n=1 Tax=Ammoniphilus sp. 3BR4 TaxID=3158265 RepID=UPI0034652C29